MKTSQVLVAAAALGAAPIAAASAASPVPYLRSATASHRHVVVVYSLDELIPGRVVVATRAQTVPSGKFVQTNIRLSEPLALTKPIGSVYRTRTRHALAPGRYYVEVSGTVVGLDCTPKKPCKTNWSNVRRVVVK